MFIRDRSHVCHAVLLGLVTMACSSGNPSAPPMASGVDPNIPGDKSTSSNPDGVRDPYGTRREELR